MICKLLLIADILITTEAILGRYVPFLPDPSWSEEMVLTLMSYMAVLSAALAIRRKAHIRMTSFDKYLPAKLIQRTANSCSGLKTPTKSNPVLWPLPYRPQRRGNHTSSLKPFIFCLRKRSWALLFGFQRC